MNFKPERKPPRLTLSDEQLADATYTAAEVKVLTEAALRLGRKEAGEEIAAACDERYRSNLALTGGDRDIIPRDGRVGLATGYQRAGRIARDVASKPSPDATSGRTDPGDPNG